MNVMVIGGCGFIGSVLVPELLRRHHQVSVIDLMWFGNHLEDTNASISNYNAGKLKHDDFVGFDAVIFLGGLSNDPMADFDPMANFHYNAALPSYLAYTAKSAGVRVFIHGGSCSVYGLLEPDMRATEELPPRAQTPYGVSKLMAEFGVLRQNGNGMRVVNFRMGTVCGWSPRMRYDLVINTMVKDAISKNEINVNDIAAERPILDIRDAVSAYAQSLTNEDLRGTYNLFSHNISMGKLSEKVRDRIAAICLGVPQINIQNKRDNRSYTASGLKARNAGIYCLTRLETTIDTVINHTLPLKNPEDPVYYNIRTFKSLPAMSGLLAA